MARAGAEKSFMKIFLDTNVLAYQFDRSFPLKQERARQVLLQNFDNAVISTQVMLELHAVLNKKLGIAKNAVMHVLEGLEIEVVATDRALLLAAANTSAEHDLSIFDALILEAAVRANCEELWSEDLAHGSTLRGVTIFNPFHDL